MTSDIHKRPFEEGTLAKLEIFEDYASAWLPTFVMAGARRIAIFDLFAGPGYDTNKVPGSAIRILTQISRHLPSINAKGTKIDFYLNEFINKKLDALKAACRDFLSVNPGVENAVDIHFSNEDFKDVFRRQIPIIGSVPSLVYLDQNGIRAIAQKYFQELAVKPQTDFLYFVSSSHFWRFGESNEFKIHFDIDISEAKKDSYRFIHRYVLNKIRQGLPANTRLRLYPFSIKKGANIHGLIFGARHPLAFDKFLKIAWKKNDINGEANFDIDHDSFKAQPDLFAGKQLTKLEKFERLFRERVLSGEITTNQDALQFAYSEGHIGSHADAILRELKKDGKISYEGTSPLVTYETVFKSPRIVKYILNARKDEQE